jgi:hypothetical protein
MLVRMADADASEAARSLANARWRGQVITRALRTLAERSGELSPDQLADLRAIADGPPGGEPVGDS